MLISNKLHSFRNFGLQSYWKKWLYPTIISQKAQNRWGLSFGSVRFYTGVTKENNGGVRVKKPVMPDSGTYESFSKALFPGTYVLYMNGSTLMRTPGVRELINMHFLWKNSEKRGRKIGLCKLLFFIHLKTQKIQGIYFEIQGTCFKICALCFETCALCFLRKIFPCIK